MTWTDMLMGLLQFVGIVIGIIAAGIFLLMMLLVIVGSYRMWEEWRREKKNGS